MKLFGQPKRALNMLLGILVLSMMLAACGTTTNTGNTPTTSSPVNGKGCTKVGVLLPESASSDRWEVKDHPLLVTAITNAIPLATITQSNAQGSADTQL